MKPYILAGFRSPPRSLRLIKPITWFPPMWAYLCGIVSSGVWPGGQWDVVVLGVILAGPVVCGDEPGRERLVRPACGRDQRTRTGRSPRAGCRGGGASGWRWRCPHSRCFLAGSSGPGGSERPAAAVAAAWIYSAEPFRWKKIGLVGGRVSSGCPTRRCRGFTGAAILAAGAPRFEVVVVALLYGLGAPMAS